jgi:hypothetical protein
MENTKAVAKGAEDKDAKATIARLDARGNIAGRATRPTSRK